MLSIWLFTDGKRGHENQSLGLAEALARLTECRIETVSVTQGWPYAFNWLAGRFPTGQKLPKPDLILGTGHATHWPMLAARRAFGGKIAVLMKPSLPLSWFDWVIAPEHDNLTPGTGRLPTIGPLNRVQPSANKSEQAGLMLIGGPSAEYGWSETALLKQIHLIALHHSTIHWQLTTSRRTPTSFLNNLSRLDLANLEVLAHDAVPADWLPTQLAAASQVWVTPDSASMVYEALSSGAAVGCFELPFAKPGRVARGLEKLLEDKRLTSFSDWQATGSLLNKRTPLNEAERCAKELLKCLTKN
jgi:mitochondrial fission protein ELM1